MKNLESLILASVETRIAAAVDAAITAAFGTDKPAVQSVRHVIDANTADVAERRSKSVDAPKTRRGKASVAYKAQWDRRKNVPEWLTPTTAKTFACVLMSAKPLTNAEIMAKTGLLKKTVESDVWRLRNYDATGNRLDLSKRGAASKALIVSQPRA